MTPDYIVRSSAAFVVRFLSWWSAELVACLPAWLRFEHPWRGDDLVLLMGGREAVLGQDNGDRIDIIRRLPLAGGAEAAAVGERYPPVRLRLGAEAALRLTIPLPTAALENLHQAVAFQLDRYTPFTPDQVYFTARAGEREPATDRVMVATTIVERRTVAEAVAAAERLGFTAAAIEVAAGEPRDGGADRLAIPELRATPRGQLALAAAAAILVLALGAAAVMGPFIAEEKRADALAQQLASARQQAEAAQRLEKEIAQQRAAANFLVDRKGERASALDILAELTRLAPDDTYLASAQFTGTQLQLSGVSRSASGLIGLFEKSDLFHKAEFRSPVTPDPATGRERFVISVQVDKRAAP
jgi:general secretion pathway protein L